MDVNFRLKGFHELILIAMYHLNIVRDRELEVAGRLLHSKGYDYINLLSTVVKDQVYENPTSRFLQPTEGKRLLEFLSDAEIIEGINALKLLGLVSLFDIVTRKNEDTQQLETRRLRTLKLTDEGSRIAQRLIEGRRPIIRPPRPERSTIFVAIAFGHDDLDGLYENEFEPACHVRPLRALCPFDIAQSQLRG